MSLFTVFFSCFLLFYIDVGHSQEGVCEKLSQFQRYSEKILQRWQVCLSLLPSLPPYMYSGTSHNGHSKIRTASIQRTSNVPPIDSAIEIIQCVRYSEVLLYSHTILYIRNTPSAVNKCSLPFIIVFVKPFRLQKTCTCTIYLSIVYSTQNNSRPSVNFRPYYQNDLAKQLIVGHNSLTIGFNRVVLALYCQKLKMVCLSVRAWHFGYFVHCVYTSLLPEQM